MTQQQQQQQQWQQRRSTVTFSPLITADDQYALYTGDLRSVRAGVLVLWDIPGYPSILYPGISWDILGQPCIAFFGVIV